MGKLKVGVCGFGGLGHVHANSLAQMEDVEIAAVCDIHEERLKPAKVEINIATDQAAFDVRNSRTYTNVDQMLKKESLDALFTALPTDLHAPYAIKAMRAGCHVFSEKPMALTARECDKMIATSEKYDRKLMIGQCLRFWPEYDYLLECVKKKTFGPLRSLMMTRIGNYAGWSADDWMNKGARSGGALLDLHLHDVDWAYHALGMPDTLCASGLVGKTGDIDDVSAIWRYGDCMVTIRGSWMYQGFTMSFQAIFEDAALDYGIHPEPALNIRRPGSAEREKVEVKGGSAYFLEGRHFLDCVKKNKKIDICAPESTRQSVALVELERKAIKTSKWVKGK